MLIIIVILNQSTANVSDLIATILGMVSVKIFNNSRFGQYFFYITTTFNYNQKLFTNV